MNLAGTSLVLALLIFIRVVLFISILLNRLPLGPLPQNKVVDDGENGHEKGDARVDDQVRHLLLLVVALLLQLLIVLLQLGIRLLLLLGRR